jgi:hypothetical protein
LKLRRRPGIGVRLGSRDYTVPGLRENSGRSGVEWLLVTVLWGKLVHLRMFERAELGGIATSRPSQARGVLDICNGFP